MLSGIKIIPTVLGCEKLFWKIQQYKKKNLLSTLKAVFFLQVHSENREQFFSSLLHFKNAEYWNGKHEANCQAMQFPCGEVITCSFAALFIACSPSNQITLTNMVLSIARCGTCYAASSFWQTKMEQTILLFM